MRTHLPSVPFFAYITRICLLLALVVVTPVAQAQTTAGDESKKRLIEQKIRLIDSLLNSPAAKAAASGTDPEAAQLITEAKGAVSSARTAVEETRLDAASASLDEGMRAVGKATRRMQSGSALSESAQKKTYDEQAEQVASYRGSASDLTRDPKMGESARALIGRIDGLTSEAQQLATNQRWGDANRKLAEAYKLATEEIARLRQGQEVVMSLKFDTPADEYAYEQKRFNSNDIMVDMLIAEGKADGERRTRVDRALDEARKLKRHAEDRAQSGQYPEALSGMEKANEQMKRALQAMGIAVF